jgi:hypothetical protein
MRLQSFETADSHKSARIAQLEATIIRLSRSLFVLKDFSRLKESRIADLEALVRSQGSVYQDSRP